ncbi:virK protein [Photobacterium aquimaris]|uniref:VirK/YbjX family protein n=1 Tax=Photobacterium aquimaris TaxID=512643 RepID=UPI0007EF41F8|nr:DUF535 family protein [Photobacterium aquimaris]OBU17798.1 virK protein [Photobacterium aquimaris]PSW02487.1 DUF535 domain-containing protein [Photobacterium aquimaris]
MTVSSVSLSNLAQIIYPDSQAEKYSPLWRYRVKFILRAIYYRKAFQHITSEIDSSLLETLCQRNSRFLEKPFRPYVIYGTSGIERAKFVAQHFNFVSQLPTNISDAIYKDGNGFTLFDFTVGDINYCFKLAFYSRYQKEGDMSLTLFNDIDENFYTLTFSIRDVEGKRQLVIGGLQGPASSPENNHKIKLLTKALFGQRPKDLMIKMITLIANVWQVDTLLAIKNSAHTYSAKRYATGKIKMDYDKHWIALGGTEFDEHLYQLTLDDIRRDPEDISRPKRAMYRRRYEWLDNTKLLLEQKLK